MALGLQDRQKIARPYGKAFMNAMEGVCVYDHSCRDTILDQLHSLETMIHEAPVLGAFFKQAFNQHSKDVIKAMDALGKRAKFHDLVTNLLKILAQKRRLEVVEDVIFYIQEQSLRDQGVGHVSIRSAIPMPEEATQKIVPLLKHLFPTEITPYDYKDFKVSHVVDPSLLGGVVIQLGSLRVDSSLKGKFTQLSHMLKY